MPKKMTDKDRILAFAFKASAEELTDAISVLKAALAAKPGPNKPRSAAPRAPRPAAEKVDNAEKVN